MKHLILFIGGGLLTMIIFGRKHDEQYNALLTILFIILYATISFIIEKKK